MGNFEKLSVLVIVVIIVMILVVAIYTWTDNPDQSATTPRDGGTVVVQNGGEEPFLPNVPEDPQEPGPGWGEIFPKDDEPVDPKPVESKPVEERPVTPEPVDPKPAEDGPAPSGEVWTYVVKAGDSLSVIAMRELGSMKFQGRIQDLNPGMDPNTLRIGQVLKMPPKEGLVGPGPVKVDGGGTTAVGSGAMPVPGQVYTTVAGDTLKRISKKAYDTTEYWGELWARNLSVLNSPDDVVPGMELFIPKVR